MGGPLPTELTAATVTWYQPAVRPESGTVKRPLPRMSCSALRASVISATVASPSAAALNREMS